MRSLPVRLLFSALFMSGCFVSAAWAQKAGGNPEPADNGPTVVIQGTSAMMGNLNINSASTRSLPLKDILGVSDQEWNVIQPRLEKVQELQTDATNSTGVLQARAQLMVSTNAPGAKRSVSFVGLKPSHVADIAKELQRVVDNPDATPAQINAKLTELRQAKAAAQEQLIKARKELSAVLTQQQEAMLVLASILE